MKYLLTFVVEERTMGGSPEETQAGLERWKEFDDEAAQAGVLIACEPLEESSATRTLRVPRDGEPTLIDGPFAESKEQLGGFCLLECADADDALAWARKVPIGEGSIEIRPVMDLSKFGYESRTPTPARA
jgi:hypothetical protein